MEEHSIRSKKDEYTRPEDVILKDIIDNILHRVSFGDLVRFNCVCKSWSDSIIPRILKSSKLIVSSPRERHIQIVDHESSSSSNTKSIIERLTLPLKESESESGQYVVGSSNGFLCIGFVEKFEILLLWNSLTNEYKNVNLPDLFSGWGDDSLSMYFQANTYFPFIGFGYDIFSNDYKIVKMLYPYVMVNSLKTNSWRKLKKPLLALNRYRLRVDLPNIGTLVNGALYWLVTSGGNCVNPHHNRDAGKVEILRLNLADEEHSWIEPPSDADKMVELELIVFQDNMLCAYQNHLGRVIVMWVLKDENPKIRQVKWTKLMSIQHDSELVQPIISMAPLPFNQMFLKLLCFRRNGEVLLHVRNEKDIPQPPFHLQNGGLCLYNPKQKKFTWFKILENIKDWQYVLPTYES